MAGSACRAGRDACRTIHSRTRTLAWFRRKLTTATAPAGTGGAQPVRGGEITVARDCLTPRPAWLAVAFPGIWPITAGLACMASIWPEAAANMAEGWLSGSCKGVVRDSSGVNKAIGAGMPLTAAAPSAGAGRGRERVAAAVGADGPRWVGAHDLGGVVGGACGASTTSCLTSRALRVSCLPRLDIAHPSVPCCHADRHTGV